MKFCIKNFDLKIFSVKKILEKTFNELLFEGDILKLAFSHQKNLDILKEYLNLFWDYNTLVVNLTNDEIFEKIFGRIIANKTNDFDMSLFVKLIIENLFNVKFFI